MRNEAPEEEKKQAELPTTQQFTKCPKCEKAKYFEGICYNITCHVDTMFSKYTKKERLSIVPK